MTRTSTRTAIGALVLPVLAGLAAMVWMDAPHTYLAINAAALLLALACTAWLPIPRRGGTAALLVAALLAVLWVAALHGVEQDGVRRWLSLGPLALHAGYLVLPLVAVLLHRIETKLAAATLCLAATAAALQPDAAVAAGIAALAVIHALQRRHPASLAACLFAIALAGVTFRRGDALASVPFVEFVPQQAWAAARLAGAGLIAVQVIGLTALACLGSRAWGAAAFLSGCTIVSWFAPFPSLLIGYGAAPIVGLGLALAALR